MTLNLSRGSDLYQLRSRVVKFTPHSALKRRKLNSSREEGQPTKEDCLIFGRKLANKALDYYNDNRSGEKVPEYELVKGLEYQVRISPRGVIFHTNFKAKQRRDDPDALCRVAGVMGPDTCRMCVDAVEMYHPKGFKNWFRTYKSGM